MDDPLNTSACADWLEDALRGLKGKGNGPLVPSTGWASQRHELLLAVHRGDLAVAQEICQTHDQRRSQAGSCVVELILPTVHQVEKQWLSDAWAYNDVLFAFWNLQQLLLRRQDAGAPKRQWMGSASHGSAVFAPAPGNDHNLGALVVSEHFRACGWQVDTLLEGRKETLLQWVSERSVDVLGLSVGHDAALFGLGDLLLELRAASRHPAIRILIGGNVFEAAAAHYDWLGADCLAVTPEDALRYCASLAQRQNH